MVHPKEFLGLLSFGGDRGEPKKATWASITSRDREIFSFDSGQPDKEGQAALRIHSIIALGYSYPTLRRFVGILYRCILEAVSV